MLPTSTAVRINHLLERTVGDDTGGEYIGLDMSRDHPPFFLSIPLKYTALLTIDKYDKKA